MLGFRVHIVAGSRIGDMLNLGQLVDLVRHFARGSVVESRAVMMVLVLEAPVDLSQ